MGSVPGVGRLAEKSSTNRNRGELLKAALANASVVLDVATELAPLLPVPFVSSIFSSARVILNCASVRVFHVRDEMHIMTRRSW